MATVGVFLPDELSKQTQQAVPGTRVTPGVVSALDGPVKAGPETAGALSLLHTTFAADDGAQRGYRNFAAIKNAFRELPGFIRWLTFSDGADGYALGLWRGVEDVLAFVKGPAHRAMAAEQRDQPFEYSQFAGVWVAHTIGRRRFYCDRCGKPTTAPATACQACGHALDDRFEAS